jgi:hypothetical protein
MHTAERIIGMGVIGIGPTVVMTAVVAVLSPICCWLLNGCEGCMRHQ